MAVTETVSKTEEKTDDISKNKRDLSKLNKKVREKQKWP